MAKRQAKESSEEPGRTAGACVLVVLAGVVTAVVFAVSPTAGVLAVWVVGTVLLWRSVRRTANPAPPPGEERPSCDECAGHKLVSVAPLEGRKGMLIYTTVAPGLPNYTHIHIAGEVNTP